MIENPIIAPPRRGRGRPRKHPKPDAPAGINVVIGKKRRSSSKSAAISRAGEEGGGGGAICRPPPPQKGGGGRRRLIIPRWHNKRARSASDACSSGGSPIGRSTPCSSSSSSAGCYRPFDDECRGDLNVCGGGGGGVLVFQCLADFEIPGPIPDLADLMSDMTIFQDFFNDIDEFNCG